mmetsp:Transcript_102717/g.174083  ORF Transcript_102717/g.174083 Transcript_102717/m.174083 type:complete len:98 (+) Transcript_102717:1493-1786(+)
MSCCTAHFERFPFSLVCLNGEKAVHCILEGGPDALNHNTRFEGQPSSRNGLQPGHQFTTDNFELCFGASCGCEGEQQDNDTSITFWLTFSSLTNTSC